RLLHRGLLPRHRPVCAGALARILPRRRIRRAARLRQRRRGPLCIQPGTGGRTQTPGDSRIRVHPAAPGDRVAPAARLLHPARDRHLSHGVRGQLRGASRRYRRRDGEKPLAPPLRRGRTLFPEAGLLCLTPQAKSHTGSGSFTSAATFPATALSITTALSCPAGSPRAWRPGTALPRAYSTPVAERATLPSRWPVTIRRSNSWASTTPSPLSPKPGNAPAIPA